MADQGNHSSTVDTELADLAEITSYDGGTEGLRALINGVNAAPPNVDSLAWTYLVAPDADQDLRNRLESLRARLSDASAAEGGVPMAHRLQRLREALSERNLDSFLVPRADEHQGEQVPKRAERLAWITGFTGSAGLAVVLADRVALFVDGRYTLQARGQVDPDHIEVCAIGDETPEAWLARNFPPGARLGYDPWLHTIRQVRRLNDELRRAGATVTALATNPLDTVWTDQPPAPIAPIYLHPPRYSGRPAARKREMVAGKIAAAGADVAVLAAPDSIAWLLNIRGGDVPCTPVPLGFAVISAEGTVQFFTDPRKISPAVSGRLAEDAVVRDPGELAGTLDQFGACGSTALLDFDTTPDWIQNRLAGAGATVVQGADPCALFKACKTQEELEGARAAHRRDAVALARFLCWLETTGVGGTQSELSAARYLAECRQRDPMYRGDSFETISGADANGAIVHYRVTPETNAPIADGSLYLVDSGAQYPDGTTDVTRTVAIGTPDESMAQHYTLVLKGHIALATLRFPKGTTGTQIDTIARQALWKEGLDYDHGTGHGVGSFLSVHEGPARISKRGGATELAAGMILSNEPGLYIEGSYGIRIEALVVVEPAGPVGLGNRPMHGFETLTLVPLDRKLIRMALLTPDERRWIDDYHARVRAALDGLLEPDVKAWLERATVPLVAQD